MDDHLKDKKLATRAVHSGRVPEDGANSVTTPIYPSSTYRMAFPGDESGYVYSRWSNPTRVALEASLASLENGTHAYTFASGMAAVNAVTNLLKAGDHVVAVDDLYGGTLRLFERLLTNQGLEFSYVDGRDPADFEKAVRKNTRLFWIETPTNPLLRLVDIAKVAQIGRARNILTAVDSTFATPYLQQPLEQGADIVHHSLSKYLAGHCDVIGGALITKDEKLAEQLWFNQYAVGAQLGPFESWLVLRGIKTLHVRMDRHCSNAVRISEFLQTVDVVERVYFPGLQTDSLPNGMSGPGGIVSFGIKADFEQVKSFAMATELFVLAESLGGVESLISHPASMTHASIPRELREPRGIGDGLIRLSVGLEDVDDLVADLAHAFEVMQSHKVVR